LHDCLYTGQLTINNDNVTIRYSQFNDRIIINGSNFLVEDSQIGTNVCNSSVDGALVPGNYTARRLLIKNVGDGPRISGSNILVEDSFISVCSSPGDHADGVQGYGGKQNVAIRHNTIDVRPAHPDVTGAIFIADNSQSGDYSNNLLIGGGYSLRIHDDATPDIGPWRVLGNRIVNNAWISGAADDVKTDCGAATMTWGDNRLVTIDSNYNILSTLGLVGC